MIFIIDLIKQMIVWSLKKYYSIHPPMEWIQAALQ
jgi:hypothetical protein